MKVHRLQTHNLAIVFEAILLWKLPLENISNEQHSGKAQLLRPHTKQYLHTLKTEVSFFNISLCLLSAVVALKSNSRLAQPCTNVIKFQQASLTNETIWTHKHPDNTTNKGWTMVSLTSTILGLPTKDYQLQSKPQYMGAQFPLRWSDGYKHNSDINPF